MGSGTDVAKDAADIVLLDDRFETLEVAVEEGRRIFANIRRFGQFLFSWHVAEVLVITTAVLAGFPPPLAGLMILWNNLVIDVLPSFALALEPSREDVMREPPRDPREPVSTARAATDRRLRRARRRGRAGRLRPRRALARARHRRRADHDLRRHVARAGPHRLQRPQRDRLRVPWREPQPWLWAALAITFLLEAAALSIPPLRDLLRLTTLPGQAGPSRSSSASSP
jgi:P-type Ca2+ transporter type 2C